MSNRIELEQLEPRCLLACIVSAPAIDSLLIACDGANDVVAVVDHGPTMTLSVNGVVSEVAHPDRSLEIRGGEGDNELCYMTDSAGVGSYDHMSVAKPLMPHVVDHVLMTAGSGRDDIEYIVMGGETARLGSTLVIDSGAGDDRVEICYALTLEFGWVSRRRVAASFTVTANLGAGDDFLELQDAYAVGRLPPGYKGTVITQPKIAINGGAGFDRVDGGYPTSPG